MSPRIGTSGASGSTPSARLSWAGLYHAYESALTNYWQIGENADPDHLMTLDEKTKDATHAFVTKLMELAGV